jgi:hypothetical protein
LCRSSATSIASGTLSHSRVDPSMSVSRNVTVPVGRSASPGSPDRAWDAGVLTAARAKLSLNRTARSSASNRSNSRGVANVRYDVVLAADAVDHRRQPRLLRRRRALEVQQHRLARRQPELILQPGELHPRRHPPVPLPVNPHKHLALRQVRPVHAARRVRPGAGLIEHRHQVQPGDRPRAAARSAASSPSVEEMNTRTR